MLYMHAGEVFRRTRFVKELGMKHFYITSNRTNSIYGPSLTLNNAICNIGSVPTNEKDFYGFPSYARGLLGTPESDMKTKEV